MYLRLLTVIALLLAASPATAEDSAIRLFAPAPNGPSAVEDIPAPQAEAIRLFSPAPNPSASQPTAPAIRGAVRETIAAEGSPTDRTWTAALP